MASLLRGMSGSSDLSSIMSSLGGGDSAGLEEAQVEELLKGADKKTIQELLQLLQSGGGLEGL